MERKLAAILAADVVGYSALMERDEAGTHERLKAGRKELFEPEIARHHGRVFKVMGDGMLAEFGSVVDAVECAVSAAARPRRAQCRRARRSAHPGQDRHQSRRGDRRGRGPLWRGRQHRHPARTAGRARRHLCLGQGGEGGREETRLRLRADGRAEGQEHRRARLRVPHQARRHTGAAPGSAAIAACLAMGRGDRGGCAGHRGRLVRLAPTGPRGGRRDRIRWWRTQDLRWSFCPSPI